MAVYILLALLFGWAGLGWAGWMPCGDTAEKVNVEIPKFSMRYDGIK